MLDRKAVLNQLQNDMPGLECKLTDWWYIWFTIPAGAGASSEWFLQLEIEMSVPVP